MSTDGPITSKVDERILASLPKTVRSCLPILEALSVSIDTYGNETDSARVHEVVDLLRNAVPNGTVKLRTSMDFVVNDTFKVSRQQVANTLWHAFTGEIAWFKITETIPPRNLTFRSIDETGSGIVDYPLNEGGAVIIRTTSPKGEAFELRLDRIAKGLEALACYCPRHFADLLNENGDIITADALLQCCIFGELIYS